MSTQPSPADLCMQNRDLSTRIQKYPWVPDLTCGFVHAKQRLKDQTYRSVRVPDITCGFVECKTEYFTSRIISLYESQILFYGFVHNKTACLATELLVSKGPCTHLRLCAFKTTDFMNRITSLYVFRASPVDLCMQNRNLRTRITSL